MRLTIESFKCQPNMQDRSKEVCGADAYAEFDRADYGVNFGQQMGFDMGVTLRIQVEAVSE